jgi:hypothetical protein
MAQYANLFGEDEALWRMTGLLHDMDYERHPDPSEHPTSAFTTLRQPGFPTKCWTPSWDMPPTPERHVPVSARAIALCRG